MLRRCGMLLVGAALMCGALRAADLDRLTVGVRGAFSASSLNDPFVQLEAFADWDLPAEKPWRFQSSSGYYARLRLDAAAGWLTGQGENAFITSVGPSFIFGNTNFPVVIDFGSSPTLISRHEFGDTNLGAAIQFTSHIGLIVDLGAHVSIGYRLQHMSNAGISQHNPGLDLHSFGMGYRF